MTRALGVEGEAAIGGADLDDAFAAVGAIVMRLGAGKQPAAGLRELGPIGGSSGFSAKVARMSVRNSSWCCCSWLMPSSTSSSAAAGASARPLQRLIDMSAIGADFVERGAAQHAAARPRVARPFGLVIAVEQEAAALVERAIAGHVVAQDEGLEEPGRVREMPFGRRSVGERLDRRVGIAERRGEVERQLAGRRTGARRAGLPDSGRELSSAAFTSASALPDRAVCFSRFAR